MHHLFKADSPYSCPKIRGVASINYRLSPYPNHPDDINPKHSIQIGKVEEPVHIETASDTGKSVPSTDPRNSSVAPSGKDSSRNVMWPTHIHDVWDAIRKILEVGENLRSNVPESFEEKIGPRDQRLWYKRNYILVGHSVGATMALKTAEKATPHVSVKASSPLRNRIAAMSDPFQITAPLAVVAMAGIYDFSACRDAHPDAAETYKEIFDGAFGPEETGAWKQGLTPTTPINDNTEVVVLGYGKDDALVENEQVDYAERKIRELDGHRLTDDGHKGNGKGKAKIEAASFEGPKKLSLEVMEFEGGHDEALKGEAIAKAIKRVDEILSERRGE